VIARHKWGQRIEVSPHKSETECIRCGVVRASRHEFEGGREIHWKEFWRDCERIECKATPPCDKRLEIRPTANRAGADQIPHIPGATK
jgi:hypothetical protein